MKGFIAITRNNPLGLILTAVAAATAGWIAYKRNTDSATKAQQNLVSLKRQAVGEIQEEVAQMQSLLSIARDVNLSYDTRKGAIDKLNEILPEHLGNLSMETINSGKAKEAVDKHTQALVRQATIQAQLNRLAEINANMAKYGNNPAEYLRREVNVFELLWSGVTEGTPIPQWEEWVEERKLLEAELKKLQTEELSQSNGTTNSTVTPTSGGGSGGGAVDEEAAKMAVNAKLEAEELRHQNELANLKRAYLNNDSMTRERYLRLSEDLELAHLNRQLDIAGLEPEKKAAINQKILDLQIKAREDSAKLLEEQEKKDQEQALSRREKQYQLEVEEATRRHYQLGTSEEQFRKDISDITDRYYRDLLADSRISEEEKARIIQQVQQKSLEDEKAVYDKKTEQFNKMKDSITGAAQAMGESMAEFFTDEETDFGDFMGNILSIMLDALEKQLIAQQAAAIAAVTINDISTKGLAGLATAMAKIALITAAFETAKAVLGNFYTGGYTGGGEWDEPKGVVHSNEFVANRFAVANPSVRPVLDLINQAQRNNTISTLRASDIAQVLPGAAGGQTVVVQQDNPELMRLIAECAQTVGALQERLKYPIKAVTTISGRNGVRKGLDDYDTLLNNKSRG